MRPALLMLALLAGPVAAEPPTEAPRPPARAEAEAPSRPALRPGPVAALDVPQVEAAARPRLRPAAPDPAPAAETSPAGPASPLAVASARLPATRPSGIGERAARATAEAVRGQVCGDPRLQGEAVAAVSAGGGCGIAEPVRLRSVAGAALSDPSLMDCGTAGALLAWMEDGARPALGPIERIDVMGHYACRPRNNQAGARLSEHGTGRAIDVGGFVLATGERLSVLADWPDPRLVAAHAAACGPFSTVLGPEANAQHRDHFHFDTAPGRGAYCR